MPAVAWTAKMVMMMKMKLVYFWLFGYFRLLLGNYWWIWHAPQHLCNMELQVIQCLELCFCCYTFVSEWHKIENDGDPWQPTCWLQMAHNDDDECIRLYVVHYIMMCVHIQLVPLSKALYCTCFIRGQGCKSWSCRSKLTLSVISDVKPIIYSFIFTVLPCNTQVTSSRTPLTD